MKYFGHDCNAGEDHKLEKLVIKHGMAAYGIYFRCCELIATKLTEYDLSCVLEQDLEVLSRRFNMPENQVKDILDYFVEIGLFDISPEGKYRNLKLLKRLDRYTERRVHILNKDGVHKVETKFTQGSHKVDVKEKKRNEKKVNKSKASLKPLQQATKINTEEKPGSTNLGSKGSAKQHSPLFKV
jgi:hypothetical protein